MMLNLETCLFVQIICSVLCGISLMLITNAIHIKDKNKSEPVLLRCYSKYLWMWGAIFLVLLATSFAYLIKYNEDLNYLVIPICFYADLISLAFLVWFSGGSTQSVFSPLIYLLPFMLIILNVDPNQIFGYLMIIFILFFAEWGFFHYIPQVCIKRPVCYKTSYLITALASLSISLLSYIYGPQL